jgi:predicted RecB family nuclease
MADHVLSKSSFIKGMQCKKALYLKNHFPELKDGISDNQQAIFDNGHYIGALARDLFPSGINLKDFFDMDMPLSVSITSEHIEKGTPILYEAAFIYQQVLSLIDILVKKGDRFYAYEVKSSTSISDTYILDAAIQYWIMKNSGIDIADISIVYINNQYIRQGELDLNQLFHKESVLERVLDLQGMVTHNIEELKEVILGEQVPDIEIGRHCHNPYSCDFLGHCWSHVPEYSIFDISRLQPEKMFELHNMGILEFSQIPDDYNLNYTQRQQIDSALNNRTIIDTDKIQEFLSELKYPLYFIDFETFQSAVPLFDNSRAYQHIPFQFSLHFLESKNSALQHFEFLAKAENGKDPRIDFIESLLKLTKSPGDILVYNIGFERARLRELASNFPQYENEISELYPRIKDLMLPFQNRYYYKPEMKGSYSIKAVLPALCPELSYSELKINEGGTASKAFAHLYYETDEDIINNTRQNLLRYCKMDTYAMVKLLKVLESI